MSCLVSSILLIALCVTDSASPLRPQAHQGRPNVAVTPVNPRGLPVRIDTTKATESITGFDLEYSVTNFGNEPILGIYLRVLIVDSTGKVINVKDTFSGERIDVGMTKAVELSMIRKMKKSRSFFIAANEVITPSGRWVVEDADLVSAIKTRVSKQTDADPAASFQTHAVTSEEDRQQIFELILRDILQDKKKSEMLQDPSKLMVLRDSVSFALPNNLTARLVPLDKEEIQALADVERKVVYLIYEPLKSEGSEVFATIFLRDAVARQLSTTVRVPFRYGFSFHCMKENGRWVIQKSFGFAQG